MTDRRSIAVLLLVTLAICAAPALGADQAALLARFAVLVGDHGGRPLTPGPGGAEPPADELLTWDYQRDNAELARLFGLEAIHTLQLGSAQLPAGGGRFAATGQHGDTELIVRARVEVQALEGEAGETAEHVAIYRVQVWRGEEILSAPTVTARLGERAIVTSALPDEPTIIWIVLQVDRLPLGG